MLVSGKSGTKLFPFHPVTVTTLDQFLCFLFLIPEHFPHRQFQQPAPDTQHETGMKQSGQRRAGTHETHVIPREHSQFCMQSEERTTLP